MFVFNDFCSGNPKRLGTTRYFRTGKLEKRLWWQYLSSDRSLHASLHKRSHSFNCPTNYGHYIHWDIGTLQRNAILHTKIVTYKNSEFFVVFILSTAAITEIYHFLYFLYLFFLKKVLNIRIKKQTFSIGTPSENDRSCRNYIQNW